MVKITIYRDLNGYITGYKATGHANTAPHGEDLVCAAVSVLTQTALLGLGRHLEKKLEYKVKDGSLTVRLAEKPDALTEAVLQTMLIGLSEIVSLHPRSVQILECRR